MSETEIEKVLTEMFESPEARTMTLYVNRREYNYIIKLLKELQKSKNFTLC